MNSRYLSTDLDSLAYSYGVIFGAQYSNFQDKDSVVPGISMQIDDFIEGFVPAISKESASLQMSVDEASQYINQFWDKLNSTNTTPLEYNSECQKLAIAYGILFGNQYSNFSDPGVVVPDEVMNLDKFLEGFTSSIRRDNESLLIDVDNASSYVKNFSFTTHQQKIAQRKGSIEEQMRSHRPYVVDEPFWDGRILTDSNLPTIKLKQLSCIIDKQMSEDKNWYENKGLKLSTYVYPQEIDERIQIPSNIPYEYEGLMISSAFSLSSCNVYLYGNTRYADSWKKGCDPLLILITDISNSNVLHFLSFEKFQRAPKIGYGNDIQSISGPQYEYFVDQAIDWVQIEDDMMYISHGHDTYAASSCGHNAYISAISLLKFPTPDCKGCR